MPESHAHVDGDVFVITRRFQAPPALVYAAWVDPSNLARWWGPHDVGAGACVVEPRPGGAWRVVMRLPDGSEHPLEGVFHELVPERRIVLSIDTNSYSPEFHQAFGELTGSAAPFEIRMTVELTPDGDGTALRVTQRFPTAAHAEANAKLGATDGWGQSFDKLDDTLAERVLPATDLMQQREYARPPAAVFAAWTRAASLDAWWGPDGFVTTTRSLDFRVGGEWIYTMVHAEYGTFPNRIRYTAIVPDARLEYLHDDGTGAEPAFFVRVRFEATPTGTRLTMRHTFASAEARAAVEKFGAVEGGRQTLARLAAFVGG